MPYSIMLDAGHGGRDLGAVYKGRRESDDALHLVLAIGEILQDNGIDVEYTRTTDIYETPEQKALEANNAGVGHFISIHRNSYPADNIVSGVESLVYDLSGPRLEMAENINAQLEALGFADLGVKARPNLTVLRRTQMPAVIVEVGFINSNTDNMLFDEQSEAVAQAIANGILDTLEPPDNAHAQSPSCYLVQTGSFRNPAYAHRLLAELLEQDYPAFLTEDDSLFYVQVGEFRTLDEAADMEQHLKQAGYATILLSR